MLKTASWLIGFALLLLILPLSFTAPFQNSVTLTIPELGLAAFLLAFYLSSKRRTTNYYLASGVLTGLLILSTVLSQYRPINLNEIARLLIIIWSLPVISHLVRTWGQRTIVLVVVAVLSLQAVWAIGHFSLQQDFGLQAVGESDISADTTAVAKFLAGGQKIIRAYGPYQHPNVLAGSLALGLILALRSFQKYQYPQVLILPVAFIFIALLATFSRAALLAVVIYGCYWYSQTRHRFLTQKLTLIFLLIFLVFTPLYISRAADPEDKSYSERSVAAAWSRELTQQSGWISGVGIGQYKKALSEHLNKNQIPHERWQIDYVHSVPLLMIAEWGILPAALLMVLITKFLLRRQGMVLLLALSPLVLLDHYLITQTAPVMLLAIVLIASNK